MIADPNKKTLIIVESPTKAKTIKRYLPSTCTVMASKGHIKDLAVSPKTGVYGVDVDSDYELEYDKLSGDKSKLVSEMKKYLKESEQLVLASDEDREGESIAYHLLSELKPKCPVFRMVFHEITRSAIINAFSSCRDINMDLVHAQEARRVVDRLHGYGISPIVSRKLGKSSLSAGRVQSPALMLIVDRENERRRFVRSAYSSVEVDFGDFKARLETVGGEKCADKKAFDSLSGKVKKGYAVLDERRAADIASELKGMTAKVVSIDTNEKRQLPAIPFTTSTLQQDASRKLHRGVKDIMRIAQSLYEKGFITYMRTDSPNLSQECIRASREQVEALYGEKYLSAKPRNYAPKSALAQEAHEAIRPAGDTFRLPRETGLTGDELKLYTLIWKRTVATQMTEAVKSTTSVKLTSGDYGLSASGTTILFDGYLKVYSVSTEGEEDLADEDGNLLPNMSEGELREIRDSSFATHSTEPSQRYNEATLVKKLESEGIGRPSTYATIISTILDRGYAIKQKNSLVPTFTGYFVASFLSNYFPMYVSYEFTSNMESGLDRVAAGEKSKREYLDDFWKGKGDFHGLKSDIDSVSKGVRTSETKSLQLEGLSYSFSEEGKEYTYEIKTGKYGPYISYGEVGNEDNKGNSSIVETVDYPGEFTDGKAEELCLHKSEGEALSCTDEYVLVTGKFGKYLKRLSDEKTANAPKKATADSITMDDIDLLYSLPRELGEDENGKAELRLGPYGYYASYAGKNHKVVNPFSVTFDDIRKMAAPADGKVEKQIIRNFGELDGDMLELLDGKYGPYIKWGKKNIPLTPEEKKNPETVSPDRAVELAKAFVPKKRTYRKK